MEGHHEQTVGIGYCPNGGSRHCGWRDIHHPDLCDVCVDRTWAAVKSRAAESQSARSLERDRKSTRLNSSHDQISYAVFCLKKKNMLTTTSTSSMRFESKL